MKPQFARRSGYCLGLAFSLILVSHLSVWGQSAKVDERPPSPDDSPKSLLPVTAYFGAEVRTLAEAGTIPSGVVIVQAGKILAVGDKTLEIPERATRVDLTGTVLTPGLIDARSLLWHQNPSSDSGANDASLNIVDNVDPFSDDWREVAPHGVTSVYVQPGRRGTLSGYGAVISVAPVDGQPHVLSEYAGLQASLGVGASSNRTRQQQLDRTKKVLLAAAEYQKKNKEYNEYLEKQEKAKQEKAKKESKPAKKVAGDEKKDAEKDSEEDKSEKKEAPKPDSKGSGAGKPDSSDEQKKPEDSAEKPAGKPAEKSDAKPPKKPEQDPVKDRLVRVLEGEIPLRLEVHSSDDVAFASKLLDDEKLAKVQVIYEGLADPRSAVKTIIESNNPLVLGPWLTAEPANTPSAESQKHWGKNFAEYPGAVVIGSFGSRGQSSRMLRAHAAKAVAHGFSEERALRAITIDAARTLGVAKEIGSIEQGKRADLVCFSGEPTDLSSSVNLVVSGGETVFEAAALSRSDAVAGSEESVDALPVRLPKRYAIHSSRSLVEAKLQPATIVINDGAVEAVIKGEDVSKVDCKVFDMGDSVITPGLFSGHITLGLEQLIDPQDMPDASFIVAADCLAAAEPKLKSLVETGFLRGLLAPGSSNPIAGTASLVRLGGESPVAVREAAAKLVLSSQARSANRFPSSLAGQFQLLQQALSGELLGSNIYLPETVEQDLSQRGSAALNAVLDGKRLVLIEAATDAEIRSALDLIERYHLRAALMGAEQVKPFVERMKALNVTLVVKPISPSTYNWFSEDIAAASKAGVEIVFEGDSAEQLRLTAASCGVPHDIALAALCDPGAELFGQSALAVGAAADFVIWNDSPVNLAALPEYVVVDGSIVTDKVTEKD